jgi:hypothetical protein
MRQDQATSAARPFVLLLHLPAPNSPLDPHWDLMIQDGDHLLTWRVPSQPRAGQEQVVQQIAAHRLEFLDFTGELTEQRGRVEQVARGMLEPTRWENDSISGTLRGSSSCFEITLERGSAPDQWTLSVA